MQSEHFEQAVIRIREKDVRFEPEAYHFIKEALDHTVEVETETGISNSKHVTAKDLLYGFRDFSIKEYGPMASTLLKEWGIRSCNDVGDIVFLLIGEGMFGKQDSDTRDDFKNYFSFEEAFIKPYLPTKLIDKT